MMKRFFIRRFCTYMVLLLLPTIVVFTITLEVTSRQIDQELCQQAQSTLAATGGNLDHVISTVIYQNDLLTSNTSMSLFLKKLLDENRNIVYPEAIYLRNIHTILRSIVEAYPYLDSVYLYLDGYPYMLTSDEGIVECDRYADMGWLTIYEQMQEERDTCAVRRVIAASESQEEHSGVTFMERMIVLDGAIVLNINEEKYKDLMNDIISGGHEYLFILNENGEVILNWNDNTDTGRNWFREEDLEAFLQSNMSVLWDYNGKWVSIAGKKGLFHVVENEQYEVYLASFISRDAKMEKIGQTNSFFLLILLADFALVAALAYNTTKRNFKQIHYMIGVFDEAEKGNYPKKMKETMKDEYDIIMNNIIFVFLNTMHLNTELQEKKIESERAKMHALQMQINPHFLYNTLQSVEFMVKKTEGKGGPAGKVLANLSDILKYSIKDAMSEVSLREEIVYLKKYAEIQKYRFGDRFIIYFEIDEEFYEARVFRLMLQPLVENSILHGILKQNEKGYIKIKVFGREGRIVFHVVDSGQGMTREEIEEIRRRMEDKSGAQIGVANVNSRLVLKYGEESTLQIHSKKNMGCWIHFSIPDTRNMACNEEK